MMKLCLYGLVFFLVVVLVSCKDFVTNIDPPINKIEDPELNYESQLPFLINGVEIEFASAFTKTAVCAADLSDDFFFDRNVPTETFSEFEDIDQGNIYLGNGLVDDDYTTIGQLRYYADDLVRRTILITVHDTTIKNEALFTGYFYGGFALYLYAAYFGLNPTQGGSPINNGPFISSDKMFDLAIDKFKKSLKYTYDTQIIKSVNSMIAKAYLYKGGSSAYDSAAIFAVRGLAMGDDDFSTIGGNNFWQYASSENLLEMVADTSFINFIYADSNEAQRINLDSVKGKNNQYYYSQAEYPNANSQQKIITWEENNLMRAELIIRGFGSGDAKNLVNQVRENYGISDINSVNLDSIYVERNKQLFPSGNRLVDERRFNKWHLAKGTWEYLPIPQSERDGNPNIN